jgi:virginiamycin B lyase
MSNQRDELVAARADAILADVDNVEAYAEHFEAQMHAVLLEARARLRNVRGPLAPLRLLRRPGVMMLAAALAFCALFGYGFATAGMVRVMPAGTNGLASVNMASGRLAMTRLPGPPGAVSAADGSVWVADPNAGQVSRIDPGTGAKAVQIPLGGEPGAIASGGGAIWVADTAAAAAVTRIDPDTDRVTQTITLPWAGPGAIAFGAGRVWVADPAARQLAEINPATGSLGRTLPVDLQPSAIAAAGQAIWVAGYDTGTVEELAPASGRVLARVRVGADPAALAVGAGSLWVASNADATVSRIDLATSAVTAVIPVGPGPVALVAGPGWIWVADQGSDTISRIDPQTDQVTASFSIMGAPTSLTITGTSVWAGVRQTAVATARDAALRLPGGWHLPAGGGSSRRVGEPPRRSGFMASRRRCHLICATTCHPARRDRGSGATHRLPRS